MNENKTKIMLSVEAGICPYWDTKSNRPTHTCHNCAEPDDHLSVMIEGVRYCLLDIDIMGEIGQRRSKETAEKNANSRDQGTGCNTEYPTGECSDGD